MHGSMAATRRPERGAGNWTLEGREVDEGARDAEAVGGYREKIEEDGAAVSSEFYS